MFSYIIRRLILLPITLFFIILVNFIIINLAPGDPVSVTEISPGGQENKREGRTEAFGTDERYLQFREFYGLTLPILFNTWPSITLQETKEALWKIVNRRGSPQKNQEINVKEYDNLRITLGDQSRFIMPLLLKIMEDQQEALNIRKAAMRFFIRGGSQQAFLGNALTEKEKLFNKKIAHDNDFLRNLLPTLSDNEERIETNIAMLRQWYLENRNLYQYEPNFRQKVKIFFLETRWSRYFKRVLTLDFGSLRDDSNKTVITEVTKRFKYSLTLAILPMMMTFVLCQVFGFVMALNQNHWKDYLLNIACLILYAIPVFVVAPFLIEKVALHHVFPFSSIPIPLSGFTSPDGIYNQMNSSERFFDIVQHIFLPIIAIIYGSLAAQSRLARTAILEVLRQDYVRTAKAKGLPEKTILFKHVGRNAAITIVTSIAGSLGIVLGGSLIVETLFEINGFGKFFYDAVLNRDYNVIMFSAFAGSFLTLIGYLIADIAYTFLDPRVSLE